MKISRTRNTGLLLIVMCIVPLLAVRAHSESPPNILVIWGDDIGILNISAYHKGLLGGSTPNLDRIAHEGAMFTDYYAQQSCTAGRSAFITGQHPFRTGLLKVGMPGAELGISEKDPTLAELLKPLGYTSAQFGKNHLGDKDKFLPTNHGFDEFFGNLYHMNAEEEPEGPFYPADPEFRKNFGPRGVIRSFADGRVEDTGALTRKRMETIDTEFTEAALDFMDRAHNSGKPFFVWFNATRMHVWTHLAPEWENKSGYGLYADGMMEHDFTVGKLLDKLDDLGVSDNTIVIYSTDNGAQTVSYPEAGVTPYRGGKGSTWEGGFRVPAMVRWPGLVKPGTMINDIFDHMDWVPTLMRAAGVPDVGDKLKAGYNVGGQTFRVHLDGFDQTDVLAGTGPGKRETIFYFSMDGDLNAVRWRDWKVHFATMPDHGHAELPKTLMLPQAVHLRSDPFERSIDSLMYFRFLIENMWLFIPMQQVVGQFLSTFAEFPPRHKPASWSIDQVIENMAKAREEALKAAGHD